MNRELARKQPAQVVKAEPGRVVPVNDHLIIKDTNRTVVVQHVNKLYAEGVISQDYRLALRGDIWVAAVALKPPPSWLRRHGLKLGGAVLAAACVAGTLWAVAKVVTAAVTALLPFVGMVLGGLLALGLLASMFGGPRIEIIQKVRIR